MWGHPTPEEVASLTSAWHGERFADGRPRVPDDLLEALARTTNEQAWAVLHKEGYERSFSGGWWQSRPGQVLVGRALTAQFLPHRPDYDAAVVAAGASQGHLEPDRQNSWVISALQPGDVMVVDIFGKVKEGSVVGDNLATAVVSRTGLGAVIDGGVRDYQGIMKLEGNFFFRGVDPAPIRNVTLAGINVPVRVGEATVLPGDVVLGTPSGVTFVPAHLARQVAEATEDIQARDAFGKLRLSEGRYRSAEIDVPKWAAHIEAGFQSWRTASA